MKRATADVSTRQEFEAEKLARRTHGRRPHLRRAPRVVCPWLVARAALKRALGPSSGRRKSRAHTRGDLAGTPDAPDRRATVHSVNACLSPLGRIPLITRRHYAFAELFSTENRPGFSAP